MCAAQHERARFAFGSCTDVGCVRDHNEDSLSVEPPLYLVCDGMGGHAAGEVASEIAVEVISQRAPKHPDADALARAVQEANLAVIRAARKGIGREGMGTTCTAAMLENERLIIAQVGDSRAYHLHHGRMQQITRDHSLMNDLIDAGKITPEEARFHPQRSVITRALGSDPRMEPDIYELNVETGDRLLLCSDGLSTMLEDPEIENILNHTPDPQRCANKLVDTAVRAGGYDNITVIVIDVTGFADTQRRKLSLKAKATAIGLVLMLAAIVGGAAFAFNYLVDNSAFIAESDGKVAIYRGLPGEALGMSFSELEEVTDINIDDLQPGLANRLRDGGVKVDSIDEAHALVATYEADLAAEKGTGEADDAVEPGADAGTDADAGDTA